MAVKGDKARLCDVAFRMYSADGKSLTEIEAALGVSRQTLSAWKAATLVPGQELDEWDKARQVKRDRVSRMRALFDRELTFLEEADPGSLPPATLDGITKLGTLVQRWEAAETTPTYDKPKVFLENLRWIISWLRDNNPAGLQILADSIDDLTMAFKESLNGNNA